MTVNDDVMKMCGKCVSLLLSDPPHKATDDTSAQEFRDLLDLNLVSYFLASKVKFGPSCGSKV